MKHFALIALGFFATAQLTQAQYTFGTQTSSTASASTTFNSSSGSGTFQYTDAANTTDDYAFLPLATSNGNPATSIIRTATGWTATLAVNLSAISLTSTSTQSPFVGMGLNLATVSGLNTYSLSIQLAQANNSGRTGDAKFANYGYGTVTSFLAQKNGTSQTTTPSGTSTIYNGASYVKLTGGTSVSIGTQAISAATGYVNLSYNSITNTVTGYYNGTAIGSYSLATWGSNPTLSLGVVGFSGESYAVAAGTDTGSSFYASSGTSTDVGNYGIAKQENYDQTSASVPTLDGSQPFSFDCYINPGSSGALFANGGLGLPAGSTGTVTFTSGTNGLNFQEYFATKAEMDTAFPSGSGTYNLTAQTTTPNNYSDQLSFGADAYPPIPQITSVTNATWSNGILVVTDYTQAVTFTWNNTVSNNNANFQLNSNSGGSGTGGNSLSNTFTIPAGQLTNNSDYQGTIQNNNGAGTNSNTIPGANGGSDFQTQVNFTLQTGTPTSSSPTFNLVSKNHIQIQTSASGPADVTDFSNGSDAGPYSLTVQNSGSGTMTGPASTTFPLSYVATGGSSNAGDFEYSTGALANVAALNAVAPDGTYTFPGTPVEAFSITGDTYPTAPSVQTVNGNAPVWDAQGQLVLDPTIQNTIVWSTVTVPNFTTKGHESVHFGANGSNNGGYQSTDNDYGAPAGSAAVTQLIIPANTTGASGSMTAGSTYSGKIKYYSCASGFANPSSNVYYTGGYQTETEFTVVANYPTGLLQAITFPAIANQTVGASPFTISATASSGQPVTFSLVSGPAMLSGTNNNTVTVTGTGTVVIQATQAGAAPYAAAANVTQSFTVGAGSQTISFPASDANGKSYSAQQANGTSLTLNATATSGLQVSYQITTGAGIANLSGANNNILTFTGTGQVIVTATQGGNANYSAATPVTLTLNVVSSTDVGYFSLQKEILYDQSSASAPTLDPSQPYQFSSNLNDGNTGTVLTSSSLTPPAGSTGTVAYQTNNSNQLYFQASFGSLNALDTAFASGTYNFTIQTSTPNTYNAPLSLGTDNFPAIPQITSVTNATWSNGVLVVTDYTKAVTFTWNNPGATNNAYFQINDNGSNINSSSTPISTTYTITAGQLANNTAYQGSISLSNNSGTSNSIPNVNGSSNFQTQVNFILQTGTQAAPGSSKYLVEKEHVLVQTSNSAPVDGSGDVNSNDPAPYNTYFQSPVAGTVSGPSSTSFALSYDTYDNDYTARTVAFTSQANLNSATPDGTYTFPGAGGSVNLTGDLYPATAAQITAVNSNPPVWDAQGRLVLDPTVANTITWTGPSVNLATNGREKAEFSSTNGGNVDIAEKSGFATGSTTVYTTLVIPANVGSPANSMTATDTYVLYLDYGQESTYTVLGANSFAAAAYDTETFVTAVALKPQTITFGAIAARTYGGGTYTLGATASSGLPVTYTVVSGPATLSGNVLTFTGAGTVTVQANQIGNGTYASVAPVTQTITVNKAPLTVAVNSGGSSIYGTTPVNPGIALTGGTLYNGDTLTSIGLGDDFSLTSASSVGTYTVNVTGAAGVANYTVTTQSATFTVTASPNVTFSQWESSYGFTGTGSGATDAPEGDGVPNLLKYLYDIDPVGAMTAADRAALPVFAITGTGDLTLTFHEYYLETGIIISVESSTDLQTWSPVTQSSDLTPPAGEYTLTKTGTAGLDPIMEVDFKPSSASPKLFIRLNVTMP